MYEIRFDENCDKSNFININNIGLFDIVPKKVTINIVVFMKNDEKILKKYIHKFFRYRKFLAKINTCNIYIRDYENNSLEQDFIKLIKAIFLIDKRKIYENAYDIACDYLDSEFYGKNLCDFYNNRCGCTKGTNINVGCCRNFSKHKYFGVLFGNKLIPCEYLGEDNKCKVKCIGCKLFTCDYLEKKGIKFKTNKIFVINSIFNTLQKIFLKACVYTPKDKIIDIMMFLS